MKKTYIITGIGTDVGKTIVSAIVSSALRAHYWKPVQAGDLHNSDSIKVKKLAPTVPILPEKFRLTEPMSPHAAAKWDGIEIQTKDLVLPAVSGNLIVEGAGGLMVPLNQHGHTYLDLMEQWNEPVIVVSRHYLGSINHTLLTVDALKSRGMKIQGIIFVGSENEETESIIQKYTGLEVLTRIPWVDQISAQFIEEEAKKLIKKL